MPSTFNTVDREKLFSNPPEGGFQYPALQTLVAPHLESFNSLFETNLENNVGLLELAIRDIGEKVVFDGKGDGPEGSLAKGNRLSCWIEEVQIGRPTLPEKEHRSVNRLIFPTECRERFTSYKGKMQIKFCWRINDGPVNVETKALGQVPVMVKSTRCNLYKMTAKDLIKHHEESEEMGGYFIVNGNEKIVRLLIAPKRNIVSALIRPSFTNRGAAYTHFGTVIRCVRPDQSSHTNTLHYLNDGSAMFRFHWRKQEYLIPVVLILKALVDTSDKEIFEAIVQNDFGNTFLTDRVELLLRGFKRYSLFTRTQCLEYLGDKFRIVLNLPPDYTNAQVGEALLKKIVLVHLEDNRDKFNLLVFMIQKLYALVSGACCADNPDSPQHQEILLGGHLYLNILKEKLEDWIEGFRRQVALDVRRGLSSVNFFDKKYIVKALSKVPSDIGQKLQYFLATGNLISNTGLDLQQVSGYTIVAEKLNFLRYISHFRCVHRGSFFAELKTTAVRKLLGEAWGFLCPVHTPDGSPCGLLNHLAHQCKISTEFPDTSRIPYHLASLGVSQSLVHTTSGPKNISVQLDGKVVGWCTPELAKEVADKLRLWKVEKKNGIPLDLEIGYVPSSNGGQYPGLFLFSTPARMSRPVKYLANGKTDMVGPFEQVYLDIACMDDEVVPGTSTHQEFTPTNILSVVANLTPFSDFNQSPRNMYQCQMGKQAMGTPAQALRYRTDNKMYRIQTGQTPIVRPHLHNQYGMDGFPNGMNAVVAVISYTGYDMEDAMILNKSSHERGFGYGSVYKSEIIDLSNLKRPGEPITCHFGINENANRAWREKLDADGLPYIGVKLTYGDPMYAYVNDVSGKTVVKRYKGLEDAYIDEVRVLGNDTGDEECQKVHIKLRIPRPPIIGDKFSSRHGQKGVCSQKWPAVDMPFTESGMQPDVIINPHAFPSRMTIGMFVESLAGKSGALHGTVQDSTPFQFNEDHTAADFFGEQLLQAGYNYHGNEPMYSGITGQEFKADIYIGCVYYQRLRHMVSDKYQVRTTGPVHALTQQPLKGRKRAGGIRFGEMERDSLLAHGVSFLLQDRLMNCSDYSQTLVCKLCGSIVSPISTASTAASMRREHECRSCKTSEGLQLVAVPFVFRYLATELMAMNIQMKLEVK
ncbi:beta and beta-prime subunits of DNA dependent RNA-polymerase [Basidiobolus meristosporus CBS 931.73]|uniref:DNA-directed RNA polymerase subunit beta n=1 Tax=Basidiobolus meristosporus CBS 931.73 TaxID=1314790 RepID=A0A1Y1YSZ3_9FUNG|nr:beta and beta-prime subunits of DNA dependent RNA-polymerase [Basidiobolus meristosporus CBS 931.73]|eukprot:ORY01079.1 beta and beta-prime subunits of DNA dependent RNA-polymerase [Basidiobolus meristosporus CBS 931.73]